jgi:Conserved hypothetical protein 2217 (DUF2460)
MTLPVFPTLPGLTLTVLKSPAFATMIDAAPNGYEVRLAQTVNPVWSWQLIYDFLHDFFWGDFTTVSELRTLMGFFLSNSGQAGAFLFTDPDDCYVGPALNASSEPNTPLAELALVNDGSGNYYSPIQRTLDGVFYEDITDLNGAIAVYANGTLTTAGTGAGEYEVRGPGLAIPGYSFMGLYLKWGAGDPPTGPITAQFNFYFRVRFDKDNADFEKFLNEGTTGAWVAGQGGGYWTIGGSESVNGSSTLKLRTARPVPA